MSAVPNIPNGIPHSPSNNNPGDAPRGKNYLQRCVEELDRSDINAKKDDKYATAYKVGAYALIALFIAVGAAAVVLTGIFAPVFVPIAVMSIICLKDPVWAVVKNLLAKSAIHKHCAETTKAQAAEYQAVKAQEPLAAQQAIAQHLEPGAQVGLIDRLKPLLAHYNYWNKIQEECEKQMREKLEAALHPAPIEKLDKAAQEKIQKNPLSEKMQNFIDTANLRQQALQAKISKAFIVAVMNNPDFEGTADNLCVLKDFSIPAAGTAIQASADDNDWAQHAILRDFEIEESDDYLVFNNPAVGKISFRDATLRNADEIAQYFIAAMRAPAAL